MATETEPACEWISRAPAELQLPELPSIGGFDFSVPPLPRLLPPWEQLSGLRGDAPMLTSQLAAAKVMAPAVGSGILAFHVTAGAVLLRKRAQRTRRATSCS